MFTFQQCSFTCLLVAVTINRALIEEASHFTESLHTCTHPLSSHLQYTKAERIFALSYISRVEFLPVTLNDSVQYLVGVGEHSIGEKEGGSVVRAGWVQDEQREERRDGVDFMPWSM